LTHKNLITGEIKLAMATLGIGGIHDLNSAAFAKSN
jgi:hypothetical protein